MLSHLLATQFLKAVTKNTKNKSLKHINMISNGAWDQKEVIVWIMCGSESVQTRIILIKVISECLVLLVLFNG